MKSLKRAIGIPAVALIALGGAVLATVSTSVPAGAATTIGPVDASIPDGGSNSLRDVLENQVTAGDTVVLQAGATYTLDFCVDPGPSSAALTGVGDIEIAAAVTVQGNGATIDQTCPERVLDTQDDLTLQDVTVTGGNDPGNQGGGLASTANVTLSGVTFTGDATEGHGGAVYAEGTLTVSGSTFTQNVADSNIGGFGGGGAIYAAGPASISSSTFTDNIAYGTGGDSSGGAVTSLGTTLSIDTSSFSGNQSPRSAGGAIVTARGLGSDAAGDGGVISITRTTIDGNGAPIGGAFANLADDADVTFENSTVTGNASQADGAIAASVDGATGAALTLVNDTITDNTLDYTPPAGLGGGAADADAPAARAIHTAQIEATTITVDGTFRPFGTVITGDGKLDDCLVQGTVESQGYNYGDDATCGFAAATDKASAPDPQLGALAANGGPTLTQLPATGSPLLDAIPVGSCKVAIDQRGITRPQGTGCDIGAVEVVVEVVAPVVELAPKFTG